jgi:hypothetical protein
MRRLSAVKHWIVLRRGVPVRERVAVNTCLSVLLRVVQEGLGTPAQGCFRRRQINARDVRIEQFSAYRKAADFSTIRNDRWLISIERSSLRRQAVPRKEPIMSMSLNFFLSMVCAKMHG